VVGSTVAMESLGASLRTFDWPSGRDLPRGLTTIGGTARGGNSASSVAMYAEPPRSGATDAWAERMAEEEVARFALQLREARRTRAQIVGEVAALANSGNDEPLARIIHEAEFRS
jgi:hypothetical protein